MPEAMVRQIGGGLPPASECVEVRLRVAADRAEWLEQRVFDALGVELVVKGVAVQTRIVAFDAAEGSGE